MQINIRDQIGSDSRLKIFRIRDQGEQKYVAMERSTHSSGTEAGFTTTTEPAMPRDTILSETTPSGVPLEHLQIAEKHTTDQPLQEELADDDPYNGRSKAK
ncbi:hypothetical protein D6D26_09072 [Aureobasidium pullulans]|nr:hypothetical protein D6D26_09072 [Aureobasidium pullulans]